MCAADGWPRRVISELWRCSVSEPFSHQPPVTLAVKRFLVDFKKFESQATPEIIEAGPRV